ncbi:MAG: response regulator, partial [Acidobacteriota bacterium]|nr:response regulator [Acidobacteriota bacterium]
MSGTFPVGLLEETPGSVLVVDDDAQVRALLVALLKPRGYVTRTAASAEEAQEQLKAFRPDVILLDLHLPGRSGQDILAELRADPVTRLLPVIMITGGATGEERLRAMAA